ncbi:MAG TPA: SAM-dependent methyltransferase, partial [Candidatus Eisenbacteria bacterium]|nr:SAM-dependent methyltransferase [Candidatus Eisenbacteria bacterium]
PGSEPLQRALRQLRPGGLFLAVEHVRSPLWAVRAVERLLDGPAVRSQGDHLLREPLDPLRAEGFVIEHVGRRRLGIVEWVAARRPAVDRPSG